MNFANLGEVLDIGRSGGAVPGLRFTYTPALSSTVPIFIGIPFQLNAVLLKSNLSVNLQNVEYQMVNVVNVQAGNDIYVIAGDFNYNNTISVLLATLRK
jgi:hypothetical protein